MIDLFQQPFMLRALAASLIAGFLLPLLGNFLVPKKLSLLGDASSHFIFASLAVSALMGVGSGLIAYPTAVLAVFGMLQMIKRLGMTGDKALAVFLSLGSATASLAITVGARINLNAVLFGSLLLVQLEDLLSGLAVAVSTSLFIFTRFRQVVMYTVNEELARVRGVPVNLYGMLLSVFTGLSIVSGVKIAGVLLVTALLVIPTVATSPISTSLRRAIVYSIIIGEASLFLGIVLSYYTETAPGTSSVFILLTIFALMLFLSSKGVKI